MEHLSSNQLSSARFVSIRLPARLSVHLSVWSLACLSICMPICLSVYLVCLSVSVSLCISVFVFLEGEMYGAQLCPLFLFSSSALFHDTLNLILPTAWLSLSLVLFLSLSRSLSLSSLFLASIYRFFVWAKHADILSMLRCGGWSGWLEMAPLWWPILNR